MAGRLDASLDASAMLLGSAWRVRSTPAGAVQSPAGLEASEGAWIACTCPTTAAAALRDAGRWSLDGERRNFDAEDWWFETRFECEGPAAGETVALRFAGLATLAAVWLNGVPILNSEDMFLEHLVNVGHLLRGKNHLVIVARSINAYLGVRRPRPRWRTPMVVNQQLRWLRTSLLGRTPGWSPPAAPVGPWRPIHLLRRRGPVIDDLRLDASATDSDGLLDCSLQFSGVKFDDIASVAIAATRGAVCSRGPLSFDAGSGRWAGRLLVPGAELWWPHTHGEPALYQVRIETLSRTHGRMNSDGGRVGFRKLAARTDDGRWRLEVNGIDIFCRGACWTPLDPVSLSSTPQAYQDTLERMRDAGMNMVRLGGTMTYELQAFYDACDELGIMVWQEFMFANMDYPESESFLDTVSREAAQVLGSLGGHPSLAVLCGNSEVEQQAAMSGAPRGLWAPRLFHDLLPRLCRDFLPSVPYWPSSAHGGAFPHQVDAGTTSYYGVGAYLRQMEDPRAARVSFATECLGFANIPDDACLAQLPDGKATRVTQAGWKQRSPRDLGAGWDFDDVRDHYLQRLFGVDAAELRYSDHDRYLELGRIVTGEAMAAALSYWRRRGSGCGGALIWWLRDLWPGAGWGILDASGRPKPCWYLLRRVLQPVAVTLSDEGLNGLHAHLFNDRATPIAASMRVTLYREGEIKLADASRALQLPARSHCAIPLLELFEGFSDLTYAYRFGPPQQDLVSASLAGPDGSLVGESFFWPGAPALPRRRDCGIDANAIATGPMRWILRVSARQFAQCVHIDGEGIRPGDDYFHVAPGGTVEVPLCAKPGSAPRRVSLRPLNAMTALHVVLP